MAHCSCWQNSWTPLLFLPLNVGRPLWPLLTRLLLDRHIKAGMQTHILLLTPSSMVNVNGYHRGTSSRQTDGIEERQTTSKDKLTDVKKIMDSESKVRQTVDW